MAKKVKYKKGGEPDPLQVHGKAGEVISWDPDSPSTSVEIVFNAGVSPFREWVSIVGQPGESVSGTIDRPEGNYPYSTTGPKPETEPEVIVDGGFVRGGGKRPRRAAKKPAARKSAARKRGKKK